MKGDPVSERPRGIDSRAAMMAELLKERLRMRLLKITGADFSVRKVAQQLVGTRLSFAGSNARANYFSRDRWICVDDAPAAHHPRTAQRRPRNCSSGPGMGPV